MWLGMNLSYLEWMYVIGELIEHICFSNVTKSQAPDSQTELDMNGYQAMLDHPPIFRLVRKNKSTIRIVLTPILGYDNDLIG